MEIINLLDFTDRIELKKSRSRLTTTKRKSCRVITSRSKQPTYKCIPYIEVVEEALCFGWIYSTIKKLPDGRLVQRLSPRRKRSHWTELNKERCINLEDRGSLGLMTYAGPQAFERAYSYEIVPKGSLMEEIIRKHDKELRPDLYKVSFRNSKNVLRMIEENNISPIRSDFEQIKKQNESGSEYWTSRDLCVALGYSTYQKFTRTINKAIAIASHKRLNIADHFNHMVEMVKLGSGSIRKVENIHLSRMACLIIAENADGNKPQVQMAREYFRQETPTTELLSHSLLSNILLYKTKQGETRIEVIFNSETFWMSQKRMADLFGVDVRTINYHLGQIYESGELPKEATIRKIGIVQSEGITRRRTDTIVL